MEDGEKYPRLLGMIGKIIEVDITDEWSYKLQFNNGITNWFKRYILEKQ